MAWACYIPQTLPAIYPLATSGTAGEKQSGQCIYFMYSVWFAKINRICSCWKWGSCLQSARLFWSPLFWFPDVPFHVIGILWGCVATRKERNPLGSGGKTHRLGFSLANHRGKLSATVKIQKWWILSCKNRITCSPLSEEVCCALKYQAWFIHK